MTAWEAAAQISMDHAVTNVPPAHAVVAVSAASAASGWRVRAHRIYRADLMQTDVKGGVMSHRPAHSAALQQGDKSSFYSTDKPAEKDNKRDVFSPDGN